MGRTVLAMVAAAAVLNVTTMAAPSDRQTPRTPFEVLHVLDGDTLLAREPTDGRIDRVRLLGIDAPELAHPQAPADCYAGAATEVLTRWLPAGSIVVLVGDATQADRDRYGRLLRYVDHHGRDIATQLLLAGAARPDRGPNGLTRAADYERAAVEAQQHRRGLWGVC
ncbi:thermonuclease family protein [Brevibacterium sp. Mu109]|uniref:thermonuclease family protein n=1 Tax=Brevibacterium sp. Mu109 TaxID=1255669 RepID=UPI0015E06C8F|nr:thermonuclease family protein [Brevibacterium sp. Mu109]